MKFLNSSAMILSGLMLVSCYKSADKAIPVQKDPSKIPTDPTKPHVPITLADHSKSPNFLTKGPEFSNLETHVILSSEDVLSGSPEFVYGSMADGCGLLKNEDGTYSLINNIENDYSVARITLDETFKPVKGEYILNALATGYTAQCSGTLITPEEHGFGPLYLSGGEWGGSMNYVFATDPYRDASLAGIANPLPALGQWTVENAVPIGKDAYAGSTVVFIGDDKSSGTKGVGQLAMYVGARGDLNNGKLYSLVAYKEDGITPIINEVDMEEGKSYKLKWVELKERSFNELQSECEEKGITSFQRVEDIDWRRGSAQNQREIYFAATGGGSSQTVNKFTTAGRVYKVNLNDNDPTGEATISCILDADLENGIAKYLHSPDNITVTENYVYVQEDPNGVDSPSFKSAFPNFEVDKAGFARLWQYNIATKEFKKVFELDQATAAAQGYGTVNKRWEFTGMIDISDTVKEEGTFLIIAQCHKWNNPKFTDPKANPNMTYVADEGSMLFVVKGLQR